jgi:hypothetical protein
MVGPCCWDPPPEPPAWLADIDQPIVLVSTALDALAHEDVFVVATIPAAEVPRTGVPANARLEQFLPRAPILARAACAVTHGGAGVTQKALASGVPVCVVPFGRDQLEVARRVEVASAGTRLSAHRLTADRPAGQDPRSDGQVGRRPPRGRRLRRNGRRDRRRRRRRGAAARAGRHPAAGQSLDPSGVSPPLRVTARRAPPVSA